MSGTIDPEKNKTEEEVKQADLTQEQKTTKKQKKFSVIKTASLWTVSTLALSASPIIIYSLICLFLDNISFNWGKTFLDGGLLFIGVSCAGSSYIDCFHSVEYRKFSRNNHIFINLAFWSMITFVIVIYTLTCIGAEEQFKDTLKINGGFLRSFTFLVLIASLIYSIVTKTIILVQKEKEAKKKKKRN